jgi:hypothetical protein
VADTLEVVKTCSNYPKHIHYNKFSPDEVNLIPPVWPLAQWGIDIVGPLPTAPGNYKFHSWRTKETPHEDLAATVDVIEMVKLQAAQNLRKYQDETRRWKDKKVKPREIKEGDLVLRRVPNRKMKGKMNNKWEGLFLVMEMPRPEACRLQTLEGVDVHTRGTRTCCRSILYRENVRATGG